MTRMRTRNLTIPAAAIIGLTAWTAGMLAQAPPQSFPNAPEGFDVRRPGIETGRVERIEYASSVTNTKRPAMVYLPPGYSSARKYPVLYLLHGIGGNEKHWTQFGAADSILDNLIAAKKAVPMIVVMPNGRASNEPETNLFAGRGRIALAHADAHRSADVAVVFELPAVVGGDYGGARDGRRLGARGCLDRGSGRFSCDCHLGCRHRRRGRLRLLRIDSGRRFGFRFCLLVATDRGRLTLLLGDGRECEEKTRKNQGEFAHHRASFLRDGT